MTDGAALLRWIVFLLLLRAAGGPPAARLLGKPYGAAGVPILLLVWSYLYWLFGSLGTLPPGDAPLWGAGGAALLLLRGAARRKAAPAARAKTDLGPDAAFWSLFFAVALLRSWAPALEQTEKFTDMALMQAVSLDRAFPPVDRWLSGLPLNYYYWGYLPFVPLLRLAGVPPEWGLNLSLCTVAAMAGSVTFAAARATGAPKAASALCVLALALFSNWEWIRQFAAGATPSTFSWWESSRVFPETITEFPFFSFMLGDLHAHVLGLPWLAVTFACALSLRASLDGGAGRAHATVLAALTALTVGIHYPANPWQAPAAALLVFLLLGRRFGVAAAVGAAAWLLYLPYWLSYERPVSSVFLLPPSFRSPLGLFLLHWGLFLTPLGALALRNVARAPFRRRWIAAAFVVSATLSGGAACGLVAAVAALLWAEGLLDPRRPESILLLTGLFTIALCEWIYLERIMGPERIRMNTVFKFYLVAWWALSLSVPVFLARQRKFFRAPRLLTAAGSALLALGSLVYPVLGTRARTGFPVREMTLDGMAYWSRAFPGEREAVDWLRARSGPNDVVWEAAGPAYGRFARVSSFSGRPGVLGWENHEWVWRRDGHALTGRRREAIERLDRDPTEAALREFLSAYRVKWVYVGSLERETYSPALLDLLEKLPRPFSNATTAIHAAP